MNKMDFSIPQRQEILGVAVNFFNNLRKFANALLAAVAGIAFKPEWFWILGILIAVGLIGMAVLAWFQYRRFTFYHENNELIINDGVFVRDRTTIPFDRIQSVHLHQNFIQRILQLTGVKIDTAGSKDKELEIKALRKQHALQLQAELQNKLSAAEGTEDLNAATSETAAPRTGAELNSSLVKLSIGQLLFVAITENHIKNGLLAAAVIIGYLSQFDEFFKTYLKPLVEGYLPVLQKSGLLAILVMIILFLGISVALSMIKVILRFFDFEASLNGSAFQIKSGLLKRNEYTIPLKKIQFMEWQTNFIRKVPGFETVTIFQGQSQKQNTKQSVEIPACYNQQTEKIMQTIFPEETGTFKMASFPADKAYSRFLFTIFSIGGILLAGLIFYWAGYIPIIYFLAAYLLLAGLLIIQFVRSIRFKINGELIIFERGWLFPKRTVIKIHKVQSVTWCQSIFQKRRNVGHVTLYTAAGQRTIRFLPAPLIKELHNFLLYKIETHNGGWM